MSSGGGSPHTIVHFVIDGSRSMCSFQDSVRASIETIVRHPMGGVEYGFISFSVDAVFSKELDDLKFQNSSTNIASAFQLLNKMVVNCPVLPKKYIIVFISDGQDDDKWTIVDRLNAIGGIKDMGIPCVLFTVAVRDGFPTNVVLQALRPNYHSASDDLPLVFPVREPGDCPSVFEELAQYMFKTDHTSASFDLKNITMGNIQSVVRRIYNSCTVKCATESDAAKALQHLQSAKELLKTVDKRALELEQTVRDEVSPGLSNPVAKPLASKLIAQARMDRNGVRTSVLDALTRINEYIDNTAKGQLLSKLSDADKQKVLGYGCKAGTHLVKSLKYHSADVRESIRSLKEVLDKYDDEQAKADSSVSDGIITQEESLSDAKRCLADICGAESLVGVVELVAIIGRLMHVKICDGTQINPYLVEVVGLPTIMTHINSVDWFTRFKCSYKDESRGESANCLMPITRNRSPKNLLRHPFGMHFSTYCLCKNMELNFPFALFAMQCSVVTFCLKHGLSGWITEVLDETYESYMCVYGDAMQFKKLHSYLDVVKKDDFRKCLVTSSDELPSEFTCEHLTKFIMAIYVLMRGGHRFTKEDLLVRMYAAMAEMVGRSEGTKDKTLNFNAAPCSEVHDLLVTVPVEKALEAFTLSDAVKEFQSAVNKVITVENPMCALGAVVLPTDIQNTYFQFSRESLSAIFSSLYIISGGTDGLDAFSVPDLLQRAAIVQHGSIGSSFDRNVLDPDIKPVDVSAIRESLCRKHVRTVRDAAAGYVTATYTKMMEETHDLATIIPRSYTEKYAEETGRNVEDFLNIGPSRLPLNACSCLRCPHFLVPKGKKVVTQDGKPRISDELQAHLSVFKPVAGMHAAVKNDTGGCDIRKKILEGGHLLECGSVELGRKVAQIESAVSAASKEDPAWLEEMIARVKGLYAGDANPEFSYEEFEERMNYVYAAVE